MPGDPGEAESRFFAWLTPDHLPETDYIGIYHASYPEKFNLLPPFESLPTPPAPDVVYGIVVGRRYLDQARDVHPGMDSILARAFAQTGIPLTQNAGLFCNTFLAHRSVWEKFLPDWKRTYAVLKTVPLSFNTSHCKPGLERAYLLERITTGWFAAFTTVKHFPGYELYFPVYEIYTPTS